MNALAFVPYDVVLACVVFALTLAVLLVLKAFLVKQLRHFSSNGRLEFLSYPQQILGATRLPFMFGIALLAGVTQLKLSPLQDKWLQYAWIVILVSQVALWANRAVTVAVERAFERHRQTDPSGATRLGIVGLFARIVLWSIAALVTLDNLGFNITTLMASLGIGGIAVALAAQNILGDLFSSVSIALDKPFEIGDFIAVDDYMGSVEYVGLKTTRLRGLGGEQIIFSNSELLKNRIRNYKRMQERRVQFTFEIAKETSLEDIEKIPEKVREIITSHSDIARFDRAHFKEYRENSLNFEVAYYMLDADFNKYMDLQQSINLALLRHLRENGIALPYPTRTVHVASVPESLAQPGPRLSTSPTSPDIE